MFKFAFVLIYTTGHRYIFFIKKINNDNNKHKLYKAI